MSETQMYWVFGLLAVASLSAWSASRKVSLLRRQVIELAAAIDRKHEKQIDMLIAILNRHGIDPVTLD